jgi:acetylornithine deacetylase
MNTQMTNVELLARLVSFDSTSRNSNLPIADFICEYLDGPQIEMVRNFNAQLDKVNLIIELKPGRSDSAKAALQAGTNADDAADRAGLILSGHLDVVPADEPGWRTDPFKLAETNEDYIARGACDMKGFVALAVNAMRAASVEPLRQPLVLILTFDEELGTLGAQYLHETWHHPFPLPRSAIIGEPTSLRAVRMHKGHAKMRITLTGRAAHSGYPHLGINAIEPLGPIILALSELRQQWEEDRVASSIYFPETPYAALNLATVKGGSAINIMPERCVLELGFRPLPGMDSMDLAHQVQQVVHRVAPKNRTSVEFFGDSPPLLTDESTKVYQSLCGLIGQTETVSASYASDAGPLAQMGIDCVLFGPGTIEVAHKPNESLPKREFQRGWVVVQELIRRFCA